MPSPVMALMKRMRWDCVSQAVGDMRARALLVLCIYSDISASMCIEKCIHLKTLHCISLYCTINYFRLQIKKGMFYIEVRVTIKPMYPLSPLSTLKSNKKQRK